MTPTLLRGGIVLPMTGPRIAFDPGSVLIEGREILAVGLVAEVDADPRAGGADMVDLA